MGRPILIAGPTASGKSALAMALARRLGGVVVNADSQQVYAEWRVLTARPSAAEEAAVPHRLYGHVRLREAYSVGRWLAEVRDVLRQAGVPGEGAATGAVGRAGPMPIIVGGTGLYFMALTEGLAPIPDVPAAVRAAGEAALRARGLAALAAELAARDPETAATVDQANPRRVLRAWEVLEATGTGLAAWKARTPPPLLPLDACLPVLLMPPRDRLYARCDARLDAMLAEGALGEVARVIGLDLPPGAPGMKAVGAAELATHLRGEATLEEAARAARTATRNYAKRQLTWMRNRMKGWFAPERPDADAVLDRL